MTDFARPLNLYHSFADFFTREFEEGARPLGEGLVSPVDGELKAFGPVTEKGVFHIKGGSYTAEELLGRGSSFFRARWVCQLYLSPRDYHRFHAPCDMEVLKRHRIDGGLFPVNSLGERFVPGLFKKNAREIIFAKTPYGGMAFVAVGALNVGSIELREVTEGEQISKGEELGYFTLGSSVLILLENVPFETSGKASIVSKSLVMGEPLEIAVANASHEQK